MNYNKANELRRINDGLVITVGQDSKMTIELIAGEHILTGTLFSGITENINEHEKYFNEFGEIKGLKLRDGKVIDRDIWEMSIGTKIPLDNNNLTEFELALKERLMKILQFKLNNTSSKYKEGDVGIGRDGNYYLYLGKLKGHVDIIIDNNKVLDTNIRSSEHIYILLSERELNIEGGNMFNWTQTDLENNYREMIRNKSKKVFPLILENPLNFFYENEIPIKNFPIPLNIYITTASLRRFFGTNDQEININQALQDENKNIKLISHFE